MSKQEEGGMKGVVKGPALVPVVSSVTRES